MLAESSGSYIQGQYDCGCPATSKSFRSRPRFSAILQKQVAENSPVSTPLVRAYHIHKKRILPPINAVPCEEPLMARAVPFVDSTPPSTKSHVTHIPQGVARKRPSSPSAALGLGGASMRCATTKPTFRSLEPHQNNNLRA